MAVEHEQIERLAAQLSEECLYVVECMTSVPRCLQRSARKVSLRLSLRQDCNSQNVQHRPNVYKHNAL